MVTADSSDSEDDVSVGRLNLEDDREWQDAEDDEEQLTFVSLFDDKTFPSLAPLLIHAQEHYHFDLKETVRRFDLDFLSCVKLINYIRSEVKRGNTSVQIPLQEVFQDERYLQPVLEDDALLFSVDDLLVSDTTDGTTSHESQAVHGSAGVPENQLSKVTDLEEQLRKLGNEYNNYRLEVQRTLEDRWAGDSAPVSGQSSAQPRTEQEKFDNGYFESYSYNEIHETMLKDTVRTDAYRDFIYENKDIFQNKVVLDVGCGTGILSMFCAKAGASRVIAVENSAIIEKARVNIQKNGLDNIITCVHGKIEEVTLPVPSVDIIVSEWMGYCLLFEAMLDSVLWARDRYLSPGGLMVPSHCTLHIAPITDGEYISENISFWNEVYGFDMSAMLDKIHDDVLVRQLKPANIIGAPYRFMELPLHTISTSDLTFSKHFQADLTSGEENLDGWVIWFDTYFLRSREDVLPPEATAATFSSSGQRGVAFSTGPDSRETHWKSGVMLIDDKKQDNGNKARTIDGSVDYKKGQSDVRGLEVGISWNSSGQTRQQTWFLR